MQEDRRESALPGIRFDRQEFAGSLGDLGMLLPLAFGLIQVNGLDATALFLCVGLYYILSGLYFRIPMPVQPMKVISAYAIAQALTPIQITTAGLWTGAALLILAFTGATTAIGRIVPRPVVRGVQLTTGILLLSEGVRFILGIAKIQTLGNLAEPYLAVQSIGPVPVGIILGAASILAILLFMENRRLPAAILVIAGGVVAGLLLGAHRSLSGFHFGIHLPSFLPFGMPDLNDVTIALLALTLPQLPMTVGNAIIAQADLTQEYFGRERGKRSSFRALTVSMGIANLVGSFFGGMPMCHGAGGLAAHYRFGARTAGSPLMIGGLLVLIAVFIGDQADTALSLLPFSVLGALLVFAGAQLALTVTDVKDRRDFFVMFMMLGIALASNLAVGFVVGIALAYAFRSEKLKV